MQGSTTEKHDYHFMLGHYRALEEMEDQIKEILDKGEKMTDLILPERMAKARRKQKAKIDEEGKTAAEIEQKQQEVEDIYGERESKYIDPDNIDENIAEKLPKPTGWQY